MSVNAIAKPVRVVQELSATDQFIRAVHRAGALRAEGRARLDADYVERVQEATARFLPSAVPTAVSSDEIAAPPAVS